MVSRTYHILWIVNLASALHTANQNKQPLGWSSGCWYGLAIVAEHERSMVDAQPAILGSSSSEIRV